MDPSNAVELRDVKKTFRIEVGDSDKKGSVFNKNPTKTVENKVLDGITLDIKKGEVLGIIGRNGSGKSTLLSIIARIMEPDSGTVEYSGKIASILELGMGFHADMSGRENIYLKGELYGFNRREMDAKIDKIIEYSGISKYIDNPVRTYSSGMTGRLAFSIMANVESDIMLVDEVLSTGDALFSAKAREHFKKVAKSGKTVVFVSHSINSVAEMCTRAVWIDNGKIIKDGPAKNICAEYQNAMSSSPEIIMDLAEAGVAEAQYNLAMMYRDGTNFEKNEDLYREWIKRAAEQGHTMAQIDYADILCPMEGESNKSKAIELYQSAAIKGNPDAKLKLAGIYNDSDKLLPKIGRMLYAMAKKGDAINQFRYADYLLKTATTDRIRALAFEWFEKCAVKKYPNAMHQIALMYKDGIGVRKDLLKMETWLKNACDLGHLPSIVLLAEIYNHGNPLPKNEISAFELYLKGANLGNSHCQYNTAIMYREGIGTPVNCQESNKWYRIFQYSSILPQLYTIIDWAKSNNCFSTDEFNELFGLFKHMGNSLFLGEAINISAMNKDCVKSTYVDSINNLASNGNIDAMKRIADYFYDGINVKKDYIIAAKWYEKASKLGDIRSKIRIGDMYVEGKGVAQNVECAIQYYEEAANLGFVPAITNILDLYSVGFLKKDVRFDTWFKKLQNLANYGNIEAIKRIANYYYDGINVKKDYTAAAKWYKIASDLGDKWSKTRLIMMYSEDECPNLDWPQ